MESMLYGMIIMLCVNVFQIMLFKTFELAGFRKVVKICGKPVVFAYMHLGALMIII